MRRGTAEIQTTWLADPQYQRDTVESAQASLDQDYSSLYSLVKVTGASWEMQFEYKEVGQWRRSEAVKMCVLRLKSVLVCWQSKMRSLEETLRLHCFYNSCQEFESWMEDKENVLNTISTDADNLGVVQAKYEVTIRLWIISSPKCRVTFHPPAQRDCNDDFLLQSFLTQLASGRGQFDDIIRVAEELVRSRHSKQREIEATRRKVSNR